MSTTAAAARDANVPTTTISQDIMLRWEMWFAGSFYAMFSQSLVPWRIAF
jgi:hypothetical protein